MIPTNTFDLSYHVLYKGANDNKTVHYTRELELSFIPFKGSALGFYDKEDVPPGLEGENDTVLEVHSVIFSTNDEPHLLILGQNPDIIEGDFTTEHPFHLTMKYHGFRVTV